MVSEEIREKFESLSPTEREIFELVCYEDLTYKIISKKLHMSESTVKTHMATVRVKFGIDQLSRRKTDIEINTFCNALKEIRDQSDKIKTTEKESEVEVKPEPKPRDNEKRPVEKPEKEKGKSAGQG